MTARRRTLLQRAFRLDSSNLGSRVVSGASYQFMGIVLRTVVTIGSTAALARLLTPADFGFVAMATVVTELAALFANFGFTNLLIQRRSITRLQVDTVFWASTLLGVLLAGVVFALSFGAAWLFREDDVAPLLRTLSLTFLVAGLPSVAWVVLARKLRFRTEFWVQTVTTLGRAGVGIGFAWAGAGAWSLVAGALAGSALQAALAFVAVPYRPRLRFNAEFLAARWRTSGGYFGSGLLFYAYMNADLVLIGRALGATALGYYQNARSLTDEIRARIAMPLQQVLFPALSALQDDPSRRQQMVLRSSRMIAAVVMPVGFGVAVMAPDLVPVLYGSRWQAMVPVMQMFGVSAALRASSAVAAPLFNASDRVGTAFLLNCLGTALLLGAVVVGLPHGIERVAMLVAAVAPYSILTLAVALRGVGIGTRGLAHILGPSLVSSMAMGVAVWLARPHVEASVDLPAARLGVHVVLGGGCYIACLHAMSRQYLFDFMDAFGRLRVRR